MRRVKNKYIFNRSETYSTEITLNKVILAYLQKLKECRQNSKYCGVPMHYVYKQGIADGLENAYEASADKAYELFMKDIDELIWTFSDNEPDISKYDFTFTFEGEMECTNKPELQRYHEDREAYTKRKQAGYEMFGEIYQYLGG